MEHINFLFYEKNKIHYFLLLLVFILGNSSECFSQNKEHSCYGKALMPDEYEIRTEEIQIKSSSPRIVSIPYNKEERIIKVPIEGTDPVEYEIRRDSIVPAPFNTRTIEIPPEYITVTKKVLKKKGGYFEAVEVICAVDLTAQKINQIEKALVDLGYSISDFSTLKEALKDYQRNNGLPEGQFDLKTLATLRVK